MNKDMQRSNALKEVFLFFGLTLGLSHFVFWGPLAFFQIPTISFVSNVMGPGWAIALFISGGFVPSLVAVFLTWKQQGRPGLRELGRRMVQFKIGWRWYLTAVALVVLFTVGQLVVIHLLGKTFDFTIFLAQLGSAVPLIILGPISEELGWRGYALDRLQTKWNALTSAVIVGVVWGLWHGPLFYMVGTSQHELKIPFIGFAGGVIALSILYTWLHNNTGGSIWTAIFFHWIGTYSAQVISSGVTRTPLYNLFEYVPYYLVAILVILIWKPNKLISKPARI